MNLKRCEKGHFYNGDKYLECPRCAAARVSRSASPYRGEEPLTAALPSQTEDSVTMPISRQMQTEDSVTVPISRQMQAEDSVTVPISRQMQAEDSVTVPISASVLPQTAGSPLQDAINKANAAPLQDEERTVSLYQTQAGIDPVAGWLVCIEGEDFGGSFTIRSGINFIGRSRSMDIVLHGDHSISREKHAMILYEPKRREFIAQIGESRELFYVNEEVVLNPIQLQQYDVLTIGGTKLMFFPCCGENFSWDDLKQDKQ